jgi:hypothetical protein
VKQPTYTNAIKVPTPIKRPDNVKLGSQGIPAKAGGVETNMETPSQKVRGGGAAVRGLRFSDNDSD